MGAKSPAQPPQRPVNPSNPSGGKPRDLPTKKKQ